MSTKQLVFSSIIATFFLANMGLSPLVHATQLVHLDFDSDQDPNEHVYTTVERDAIEANIAADYAPWDFSFTQSMPDPNLVDFASLIFNAGPSGGVADEIDFGNLNKSTSATINAGGKLGPGASSADWIGLTSTIGAHELGHTVGLRHADAYGPIGTGVSPVPGTGVYNPVYPGPVDAPETIFHTMASSATGHDPLVEGVGDIFFGEREAVKLTFNDLGTITPEAAGAKDTIATAQPFPLSTISVPNTLAPGSANFGKDLFADVAAVEGYIERFSGEFDLYSFEASAGDLFNFEVIAAVLEKDTSGPFLNDSTLSILGPDGETPVDYYGVDASNKGAFETFNTDPAIIDLVIPADGTYYAKVQAASITIRGDYNLYGYRFSAVPEPTTIVLGLLSLAITLGIPARRRLA